MKGIIVNKEQFKKLPTSLASRLMIIKQKEDKYAIMDIDKTDGSYNYFGEAICVITGEMKIPTLKPDGTIRFIYPKWCGETIEIKNKQEG